MPARLAAATWMLVAAIAAPLPAAAGPGSGRVDTPVSLDNLDQGLFREAVLQFSNEARRDYRRAPVRLDAGLGKVASGHARNMARLKMHAHVLPAKGERDLGQRMHRQSIRFRLAGENIAQDKVLRLLGRPISASHDGCRFTYADTGLPVPRHTYATLAEQVVKRWLASPRHRASLLSKNFTRLGAGLAADPTGLACGDLYLVQVFAD